jgi:hypothetical protein
MELLILQAIRKLNGVWPMGASHLLYRKSDKRYVKPVNFEDGLYYAIGARSSLDTSELGRYGVLCDRETFELYRQDTMTQAIKLAVELQKARDEIIELRNLLAHYKKKI